MEVDPGRLDHGHVEVQSVVQEEILGVVGVRWDQVRVVAGEQHEAAVGEDVRLAGQAVDIPSRKGRAGTIPR